MSEGDYRDDIHPEPPEQDIEGGIIPQKATAVALRRDAAPMPEPATMDVEQLLHEVALVKDVMKRVLQEGVHYGVVPGAHKPSLWQPGADILNRLFKLKPSFEVISSTRNRSLITYCVKCTLVHWPTDVFRAEGVGACSTSESKYTRNLQTASERARRGGKPPIEVWELDNTILKMAAKRAKVAACLNATAASEIFTQDVEDMPREIFQDNAPRRQSPPARRRGGKYNEVFA